MSDAPGSTPAPTQATDSEPIGVPETLKTWAGITWRVLVILAGFGVLLTIMGQISIVLVALFLAGFFTALAQPIMKFFQRFMPKVIALVLAIITIMVAVIVVLFIVVRSIISEAPALQASVTQSMDQLQTWLQTTFNITDDQFNSYMSEAVTWLENAALDVGKGVAGSIGDLVLGGSVFLFGVIFFMMTPQQIWNWVVDWMPKRSRPYINTSGDIAWSSLSSYTRGMVIVAICDSVLVFIGLVILQVPLAPALAAIVFFGAFIPVIGAPIATFFAAIVALAERGPIIALLVVVLTVIVGSFDGDVLQPLVMGKAVSLSPLAIIILIAIGSVLLGIIGALVAVPIGSAIYGVLKYVTGRDPDHPLPGEHGPPDDTQVAAA